MNWIDVNERKPNAEELQRSRCWDFLCNVMIPDDRGSFSRKYVVLKCDITTKSWNCRDMIVTHWCEIEHVNN